MLSEKNPSNLIESKLTFCGDFQRKVIDVFFLSRLHLYISPSLCSPGIQILVHYISQQPAVYYFDFNPTLYNFTV